MRADAAPTLTAKGACSYCDMTAVAAGNGSMKVCPRCYAVLWHREDPADARTAELRAQQMQVRAERDRRRQERQAEYRTNRNQGWE